MSSDIYSLAREAQAVFNTAEAEGREPTAEERRYVESLLQRVDGLKARQRIDEIPGGHLASTAEAVAVRLDATAVAD